MFTNRSKFDVQCLMFLFLQIQRCPSLELKGVLCVRVCSLTDEQDCAACITSTYSNTQDALHWNRKASCVLEYAHSQTNKTVQHVFVRVFTKQSPTAMLVWTWHKTFKEESRLCRRKGSGRPKTSEEMVERVCKKILQSTKKLLRRTSLEIQIQPTTVWRILRICHNSREQAKTQTELMCAVAQAERMVNMCEISYEIQIFQNFSFKFGGIIHTLFNIKPV